MLSNIGLYSYGAAALAFALLAGFSLLSYRNRQFASQFILACMVTAAWAAIIAISATLDYPQVKLIQLAEVLRNFSWCYLLLNLGAARLRGTDHPLATRPWKAWLPVAMVLILGTLFTLPTLSLQFSLPESLYRDAAFVIWLGMAILVLLLLEQIYRYSDQSERWTLKFLCIGLGMVFAYDFALYAEALLFRQLDSTLWQARGFVIGLAALPLAVSWGRIPLAGSARGPSLLLSRHVAFHSITLLGTGVYLITMAVSGYFIRYLGGSWGGVLQIAFLCGAALLLMVLLFSGQIRAKVRVWLSKNFFSYKYDYRIEWLKFTRTLAAGGDEIPVSVIKAIAELVDSPGGLLWAREESAQFQFAGSWEMAEPEADFSLGSVPAWLAAQEWIIDLDEWRESPDLYRGLDMPPRLSRLPRAWLIIPLLFTDRLEGVLLLKKSDLRPDINWEDRDLLKVAGRQAASHLAQFKASGALVEARQFEAFNRLSAYVVHDLKNILAQQSLIVSNAEKHKHKPEFVDDVISTVRNSVDRMTRLMEQMRSGARGPRQQSVELSALLRRAVDQLSQRPPAPRLKVGEADLRVVADREQLENVFTHIIQNAQEATAKDGRIEITLNGREDTAVVTVSDNGIGMDEAFLRNRLFKPFDSTKGLTGMGIGAFESRELIRSLGGDIQVQSRPGEGSVFRIVLPCSGPTGSGPLGVAENSQGEFHIEQ